MSRASGSSGAANGAVCRGYRRTSKPPSGDSESAAPRPSYLRAAEGAKHADQGFSDSGKRDAPTIRPTVPGAFGTTLGLKSSPSFVRLPMHRIVTGSFPDFAGAARGVSALIAAGFADSRISILAIPPPSKTRADAPARTGSVRAGASVLGALGAMVGPGSVWALATPDTGALLMWAPTLGAMAGACLGAAAGALLDRFAHTGPAPTSRSPSSGRADTESVTVVVDEARAADVEAILRQHGAALVPRTRQGTRAPAASAQPLQLMPGRS